MATEQNKEHKCTCNKQITELKKQVAQLKREIELLRRVLSGVK
jgi:hypothetical protein